MEEITLNVKGMMCNHCVMHVTKALESVEGVESVNVSLTNNKAIVKGKNLKIEDLENAVKNAGYEIVN